MCVGDGGGGGVIKPRSVLVWATKRVKPNLDVANRKEARARTLSFGERDADGTLKDFEIKRRLSKTDSPE